MNNEWQFEQTEFMNSVRHEVPGGVVEVTVTAPIQAFGATVEVEVVQGRGYLREQTTAHIPVEVLIRMLEHAGFSVTRR